MAFDLIENLYLKVSAHDAPIIVSMSNDQKLSIQINPPWTECSVHHIASTLGNSFIDRVDSHDRTRVREPLKTNNNHQLKVYLGEDIGVIDARCNLGGLKWSSFKTRMINNHEKICH